MRQHKRVLSLLLLVTMLFTIFPVINVQALEGEDNVGIAVNEASMHSIMNKGSLPKEKMISMLKKQNTSLTNEYISNYVNYVISEANIEGVDYDVVFGLTMLETSYLKFGGDVKANQNNFGGLGATGNGEPGLSFSSVQIGVRAVVQHLKAYATTEPPKQTCVDPRYGYVQKGCAKYVEWLGIHENPNGKGWASGYNYGATIIGVIAKTRDVASYTASKVTDITVSGSKVVGAELTIAAKATPASETLYRFSIYNNTTKKETNITDWSKSNTCKYVIKSKGAYTFKVYVKNSNSIDKYDSAKTIGVNISDFEKSIITDINISGAVVAGQEMVITATATPKENTLYRYVMRDEQTGKITTLQTWTSSNVCKYVVKNPSKYLIKVYVKNKNSDSYFDSYKTINHTVLEYMKSTISDIKVNDYQKVGQEMSITAVASPSDTTLYKCVIKEEATGKIVVNTTTWSTSHVIKYTPQRESDYTISVYVKNKDSKTTTFDAVKMKKVTVISYEKPKIVDYSFSGSNKAGEQFVLEVKATISENTLYRFLVQDTNGKNIYVRNWSTSSKLTYKPSFAGTYKIVMQVKNKASSAEFEDSKYVTKAISPVRTIINSINVTGSKSVGNAMTINIDSTPTINTKYRIVIMNKNTNETVVLVNNQKVSMTTFTPSKAGTYLISVMVRNVYSDSAYYDNMKTLEVKVTSNKLIVVDPGHGGSDPGAMSGSYIEKNMNLTLSLAIRKALIDSGYDVEMTRIVDTAVDLNDRARLANNKNADLFICVHHNSFTSSSANGTEVYYSSNTMDSDIRSEIIDQGKKDPNLTHSNKVAESKKLSDKMAPLLSSAMGLKNRGSFDMNLCVCRNTIMPAILLEAGFVSNANDAANASRADIQQKVANNLVQAVKECGY